MFPRTLFLSRLIGLYCILASLAMLLRGRTIIDTVALLLGNAPLMFLLGAVSLCAGIALVLAHNIWSGGAVPVIVTLVGWAILLKGLLFLSLTPIEEAALFLGGLHYAELFHVYAAISLALGAYLTYAGFTRGSVRAQ